jgi:hypothetical protein
MPTIIAKTIILENAVMKKIPKIESIQRIRRIEAISRKGLGKTPIIARIIAKTIRFHKEIG